MRSKDFILAAAVLVLISGNCCVNADELSNQSTTGVGSKPTAKASVLISPTNAYLEIHKTILAAKCYEDFLPVRAKASIAKDKPMSAADRSMMFPLMKELMIKNIRVTSEHIDGDVATLSVVPAVPSKNETTTGVVKLLMEGGKWKLDTEKWSSKMTMQ